MPAPAFDAFFATATGGQSPYGYQMSLANFPCESRFINIPTGPSKTAAAVLAWLYNRTHNQDAKWPRRLAYWEAPLRAADERASA